MPCQTPHLDESTTGATGISPGPVGDEEILLREILNPGHVVGGALKPAAISLTDLKERGFSVHRLEYITRKSVEDEINQRLARPFQGPSKDSRGCQKGWHALPLELCERFGITAIKHLL